MSDRRQLLFFPNRYTQVSAQLPKSITSETRPQVGKIFSLFHGFDATFQSTRKSGIERPLSIPLSPTALT